MCSRPASSRAARGDADGEHLARKPASLVSAAIVVLLSAVACSSPGSSPQPTTDQPVIPVPAATLQSSPYPYTTPLPPETPTLLDGLYTKTDPKPGTPVPCRRCPDYAPEGGLWTLSFDKGIFRIFHTVTGWRSVGSFTVAGDRVTLFNDPVCAQDVGIYTWRLEKGTLILDAVEDPCAIKLRAMNLTKQVWASCQPPNIEAAVSDHWPKPPGCDTP